MVKSCKIALLAICCFVLLAAIPCGQALAAEPLQVTDYPLVPLENPGFVRLVALTWRAELTCLEAGCMVHVVQTYQIHNRDRVQTAKLRLGLPAGAPGGAPLRVTLGSAQGPVVAPTMGAAPVWEVDLGRNERKTVVALTSYQAPTEFLVRWAGHVSPLAAWGAVEGVNVAFRLPQFVTDDAFSLFEPKTANFDGQTVVWEYENLGEALPTHELAMLSPGAWQQLRDLAASSSYEELAQLYLAIQQEAQQAGIPWSDRYAEIVAALQAALQRDPQRVSAHVTLAQLYRARAEAFPDLRVNYLLLSTQELSAVVAARPQDAAAAEALSSAYYDVALAASEKGDPAGALAYLEKAQASGSLFSQDQKQAETLTLRWALDLAEQGQVTQALLELGQSLSPSLRDALLRYAPPLVAARTEVELSPGRRAAQYQLRLYPLVAADVVGQLQQVAGRAQQVEGCSATLSLEADLAILELDLAYRSLSELRQRSVALSQTLAVDPGLLATLIATPWQNSPQVFGVDQQLWRTRARYREWVDLSPMEAIWNAESQYIQWRLVELQNTAPEGDRARLEQRLALMTLGEQRQIWEGLPSGSYWVYRVRDPNAPLADSWLLDWGQQRDLAISRVAYRWEILAKGALAMLALVVGAWGASKLARKWRA